MVHILVSCESPLYVHPHSKIILNQSINDDSEFLTSHLVMDYSLLVGLDEDSGELVLGIIGNFQNHSLCWLFSNRNMRIIEFICLF